MKHFYFKREIPIVIIILTSCFNGYAQINFEPGYFIDNNDQRVECLIKNIDWKSNPSEFEFKIVGTDEPKTMGIATVKEFGVTNTIHKYYRFTVGIDRSTEVTSGLSIDRSITLNEEQIFLRPLIEGKASLYVYEDRGIIKYFYKVDDQDVEQLLYKKYKTDDNRIGEVNRFRYQISSDLSCDSESMPAKESLLYRKQSLIRYFTRYNECNQVEMKIYEMKNDRDFFNLYIRPGLNNTSLSISNRVSNSRNSDFGSKSNFRLGVELEFLLPFNKNKWAFIIEPTYQYFEGQTVLSGANQFLDVRVDVDYKSIEVPVGIRHYFYLNDKSKLFLNAAYVSDLDFGSKIDFILGNTLSNSLDISTKGNLVFGGGYNFNYKFNIELRYGSRHILNQYNFWNSDYKSLMIICGINIF